MFLIGRIKISFPIIRKNLQRQNLKCSKFDKFNNHSEKETIPFFAMPENSDIPNSVRGNINDQRTTRLLSHQFTLNSYPSPTGQYSMDNLLLMPEPLHETV